MTSKQTAAKHRGKGNVWGFWNRGTHSKGNKETNQNPTQAGEGGSHAADDCALETPRLVRLREKTVWNFHLFNDISIYIKQEFSFFSFDRLLPRQVCGCSHPKHDIISGPLVTAKECFFPLCPRVCTQGFHNAMLLPGSSQLLLNPSSELPDEPCPKSPWEVLW